MERYTVALKLSPPGTRVLVHHGPDEVLRAVLPSLSPAQRHPRTMTTFLESLALWTDQRLRVVLPADAAEASYYLNLTDEMGLGVRGVYFETEVVEPRRRRPVRLGGIGDFRDVRQLLLPEVTR
jgi:hypothetical protein